MSLKLSPKRRLHGSPALSWTGLLVWLVSVRAGAVGLGDMVLASPPGQPLEAVIPLEVVTVEELRQLRVGVASELTFLRNGLNRSPQLDELRFETVRESDGGSLVRMTSPNPLATSMTVLVEATWLRRPDLPSGRLIRVYSFGPEDLPVAGAAPRPVGAGSLGTYGPVREGETLWSVAERFRAPAMRITQVLVALFEANPRAFGGNMNGMYQGATLRVPEAVQARRLTVEEATAEAVSQLDEWLAEAEAEGRSTLSLEQGEGADSIPGTERLQAELEGVRQLLETRVEELRTLRTELEQARAAVRVAEAVAVEASPPMHRAPAPPPGLRGLWIELNRAASRAVAIGVAMGLGTLLLFGMLIGFLLGRRGGGARERGDVPQPLTAAPAEGGGAPAGDIAAPVESQTLMDIESQLDLARAQVDMGDAAGARKTLRAIIKMGGEAQRRQAKSLLREIESLAKKGNSSSADDPN